ncbi:MAG TPA: aldose epimerase family protein [Acidobacteriaceae bacterium]|nr:aldose epimerase family protein [Acidobacteriaceae bacterium]
MAMRFAGVVMASWMTLVGTQGAMAAVTVTKGDFGKLPDGRAVEVYTAKNAELEVRFTTYGARIVSLMTRDRDGKMADVVLGYNSVDGYLAERKAGSETYFGAIVGRYGNRIRAGKFSIGGAAYQVPPNNNGNALHGGPDGFADKLWTAAEIPNGVEMSLVSPDGEMGFPGKLTVHVRYTLLGSAVHIAYSATTDKATVTNLTNHSYFNLSGDGSGTILGEVLEINADGYTPVDAGLIPVGGVQPVAGTPFDFRKPTEIGARINESNDQLKIAGGYDHNWVLKKGETRTASQPQLAAKLFDPKSGRVLTVSTTEPGVQFYSGNFLDGSYTGKAGVAYVKHAGLCLETQHFPDSPNQPAFPSTLLKPGQTLHSETVFAFSTRK